MNGSGFSRVSTPRLKGLIGGAQAFGDVNSDGHPLKAISIDKTMALQ
jgi:hypothetical protein